MTVTETSRSAPPLAAGLFGGAPDAKRRDEPLAMAAADTAATRRESFSDLFRADGGQLHAA